MDAILIIVFSVLTVFFSILRRVYSFSSGKKLYGEELESRYQRAFIQIGNNKNIVSAELWFLIVLFSSLSLIRIENIANSWAVVFAFATFLVVIFVYLANYQPRGLSINLAKTFSGLIVKTIQPIKKYFKFIPAFSMQKSAQGRQLIYDEPELVDLLNQQLASPNNKLDENLLIRLIRLTKKNGQDAGELMTSLKKIRKVNSEEEVGPIIIDELHKTGNKYFLVEDKKEDELIGYIKLRDLTSLKNSGKFRGVMHRDLEYVEINDDAFEIIDLFLTSTTPIFLVRDSGETVGVVTIDDCLESFIAAKSE